MLICVVSQVASQQVRYAVSSLKCRLLLRMCTGCCKQAGWRKIQILGENLKLVLIDFRFGNEIVTLLGPLSRRAPLSFSPCFLSDSLPSNCPIKTKTSPEIIF